ncbi:MAG: TonB-dependent receptor plug domain-containing protein [Flammeovirgaceae bacterium]
MKKTKNTILKTLYLGYGLLLFCIPWQTDGQNPTEHNEKVVYSLDVVNDLLDTQQVEDAKTIISKTFDEGTRPEESIFSTHVLTKREISGFGATSIPEALKLVPGVLVKQLSVGVYEVHLQADNGVYGLGNPMRTQNAPFLLMVDFEPVDLAYNHQIAWESVPISMAEIAQIEVIKAGQPVWFGAHAVSGVIHIIRDTDEWRNITIRMGTQRNFHTDLKLPIHSTDQLKVTLGGHFNYADKSENQLFVWNENRYVDADSALLYQPNAELTNLFSQQSFRRFGGNLKFEYTPSKEVSLHVNTGVNFSEANLPWLFIDQLAETRRSSNRYAGNVIGNYKGLQFQAVYRAEAIDFAEGYSGYAFNTTMLLSKLNYTLKFSDDFFIRPNLSFRSDRYQNKEGDEVDINYGLPFDRAETRQALGGGLAMNLKLNDAFKLLAGVSAESVNLSERMLFGGQLAAMLNLSETQQLRAAVARSTAQPTLEWWTVNRSFRNQLGVQTRFQANMDLEPVVTDKVDIAFETPLFKLLTFKAEGFYASTSNPIVQQYSSTSGQQLFQMNTVDGRLNQYGVTLSSSIGTDNFTLFTHATWVNTQLTQDLADEVVASYTPQWYGGVSMFSNFFSDRLQVAGSAYFGMRNENDIPNWNENMQIGSIFSLRGSYKIWQESTLFVEVKELALEENIQHPFASTIPNRFLIGGSLLF